MLPVFQPSNSNKVQRGWSLAARNTYPNTDERRFILLEYGMNQPTKEAGRVRHPNPDCDGLSVSGPSGELVLRTISSVWGSVSTP